MGAIVCTSSTSIRTMASLLACPQDAVPPWIVDEAYVAPACVCLELSHLAQSCSPCRVRTARGFRGNRHPPRVPSSFSHPDFLLPSTSPPLPSPASPPHPPERQERTRLPQGTLLRRRRSKSESPPPFLRAASCRKDEQSAMYDNYRNPHPPGMQMPPANPQPGQFDNSFYSPSSDLLKTGLGVYGGRFLGSSSEFMQSNISRYLSNPQYYFHVNDQYVRNKLKVILFPFLHRGHWTRISEPVGGRLSYKPPMYDINAPDLYIPFMAFGTFIILAGFTLGFMGKFTPEAINLQFSRGLIGWGLQIVFLKGLLYSMGGGEVPLLDLVAYSGYLFAGLSLAIAGRLLWAYSYYVMMPWMSLCMGVFLVRTMKRVLFAETRGSERHSTRQHYFLLFMAIVQFPLFFWLGSIGA